MDSNSTLFEKTAELEKELSSTLRKRSPNDKQVVQLRQSIRENYEKIIFSDIAFASSKDVDHLLWKSVYYKPIEEFRKIIRKYHSSAFLNPSTLVQQQQPSNDVNSGTTMTLEQQQQMEKSKEKLHKSCQSLQSFLEDGTLYYESLFKRLKAVYDTYRNSNNTRLAKYVLSSLHKNLISQGDMARYSELYKENNKKDYTRAKKLYLHALELIPNNGNPHNQLAVIATYQDDECEAIYRYFRSLAVSKPFSSAKENLRLLFEKNRTNYEAIVVESSMRKKQKKPNQRHHHHRVNSRNQQQQSNGGGSSSSEVIDPVKLQHRFLVAFIRLHGILFTRISMEKIPTIQQETLKDFESLFSRPTDQLEELMLKLSIMLIFTIENARRQPQPQFAVQPSAASSNTYFQHALAMSFDFFARLVLISAQHDLRYLNSISIFMKFMDQNKNLLQEDVATRFVQNFIEFLQVVSAKRADFRPSKGTSSQVQNAICLPEDVEISGFSYVEGFVTSIKTTKDRAEVAPDVALATRLDRLSGIVSNLLIDESVRIYYDYANHIYTMVNLGGVEDDRMSSEGSDEEQEEVEEPVEEEETVVQTIVHNAHINQQPKSHVASTTSNQFISFDAIDDDDLDDIADDELILTDDEDENNVAHTATKSSPQQKVIPSSIVQPFGVSTNTFTASQTTWQNPAPQPTQGNLMSQLLQPNVIPNQQTSPQPAHNYGFFGNQAFFNQMPHPDQIQPPALYPEGTVWSSVAPQYNPATTSVFAQNARVIERPFHHPYGQFGPQQHPMSAQQSGLGVPPTGAPTNGSTVIDAPFGWRAGYQPQPQQQQPQQQPQQARFTNVQNSFIP